MTYFKNLIPHKMQKKDEASVAQKLKTPLKFKIEGEEFKTFDQYMTGAELKKLGNIPLDVNLYLKVQKPYVDELIENDKVVNIARREIEKFFVKDLYEFTFNGDKFKSYKKIVSGKEIFSLVGIENINCFILYQKFKNQDFEKISLDEKIDLSNDGIEKFITKDSETFVYTLDGEHEMSDSKFLTAKQILDFGAIDINKYYLIQKFENDSEQNYAYSYDNKIEMSCKGLVFITKEWLDVADLEEYGKKCDVIPPSRNFKIKIDKNYYIVNSKNITQEQLIALGGHPNVTTYDVYKFMNGNPKPIKIAVSEVVDLTEKCLVRFVLMPKEQKDGKGIRQNFTLPEEDINTLSEMGLQWEALSLPVMWLVIYDYPIPDGYNVKNAVIALQISSSYPASQIDMAHFHPPLQKNNGKAISCATNHMIDSKSFQQWSRHRKPNEWKPGVDCLATHLALVDNWLINDLTR